MFLCSRRVRLDAEKWRQHEKEQKDKALRRAASTVCIVELSGEDTKKITLTEKAERTVLYGLFDHDDIEEIVSAEHCLDRSFRFLCKEANESGLTIEGSFYPSHRILKITKGKVTVKEEEEK